MPKLTITLILGGLLLLGNGVYMHAKAGLAQLLINHTWYQRQSQEQPAKPWPWADTRAVALLEFPSLDIKRFIMQDAHGESLAFGPGLVTQGALPGDKQHSIVAGHRDSHFKFLQRIKVGDHFSATNYRGQRQVYRVVEIRIINSEDELLVQSPADGLLSLITCYPFNDLESRGPLRLVINAVAPFSISEKNYSSESEA